MEKAESSWQCHVCSIECPEDSSEVKLSVASSLQSEEGGHSSPVPVVHYATRSKKRRLKAQDDTVSREGASQQSPVEPITIQPPDVKSETVEPIIIQPVTKAPEPGRKQQQVKFGNSEKAKCQLCGKEFQRKAALHVHMLCSHRMTPAEYLPTQQEEGEQQVTPETEEVSHPLQELANHECKVCGKTKLRNRSALRNHLRTHRITVAEYNRIQGNKSVKTATAVSKKTQEAEDKPKCMLCAREFPSMNSLQNHIRGHKLGWYKYHELLEDGTLEEYLDANPDIIIDLEEKKTNKTKSGKSTNRGRPTAESQQQNEIFCPICKKSYKNIDSLRSHLRNYHPKAENRPDIIGVMEEYRRKYAACISPVIINCPVCNVQFNGQRVLRHLETVHGNHPEFEDLYASARQMFQKQRQDKDMKAPSWTTYKTCKLCGKQMRQRFLRVHVKYRCAKNPQRLKTYRCNRCSYATSKQESLVKHLQEHEPGKTYMCHQCGKAYKNNSSLVLHERTVHQMIRKVPPKQQTCEYCGKTFMYKFRYDMHVVSHTGLCCLVLSYYC